MVFELISCMLDVIVLMLVAWSVIKTPSGLVITTGKGKAADMMEKKMSLNETLVAQGGVLSITLPVPTAYKMQTE